MSWRPSPDRVLATWLLVAVVLMLGGCGFRLPGVDLSQPAAGYKVAPPWQGIATGQVKEFKLTIGRTQWELSPGKVVEAYAYNGRVPGPELRVTEGDTVRVTVTNELTEPTTVHWHGVEVPNDMDGVPKLSQEPIPPGGAFTYEFVATPAGTRWYHAHFNELSQQGGGLVGTLIVEPRDAGARQASPSSPAPDREYTLVTNEWVTGTAPALQPATPTPSTSGGMGGMMGRGGMMGQGGMGGMMGSGSGAPIFDTFAVNGKAYPDTPPLLVRQGERVRLKLFNMSMEDHPMHLHGHTFQVVAIGGQPVDGPLKDTITVRPMEQYEIEFVADNPGTWLFHCHNLEHMGGGLMTELHYR